jgi:hypothetical protein
VEYDKVLAEFSISTGMYIIDDSKNNTEFKYFEGDLLPNGMTILASTLYSKNDPRYSVASKDKKENWVMTEEEIDNIMTEYYESKKLK